MTSSKSTGRHAVEGRHLPEDIRRLAITFAAYAAALFFLEIVLSCRAHGGPEGLSVWMFLFVPAQAMFLTFLTGWFRHPLVDKIVGIGVFLLVTIFYGVHTVYFQIFGSMFSFSMIGMGADAVGNFGWGMGSTILSCLGILSLVILPLAAWIVSRFTWLKEELNYRARFHGMALAASVVLWLLVVLILPLGGTKASSAYNAYHNTLVDTDTASTKIGVLSNSMVEVGRMVLNHFVAPPEEIGGDDSDDLDTSDVDPLPEPEPDVSANILEELDPEGLAQTTDNDDVRSLCEYVSRQPGTARNPHTGKFKNYNLIYICAESFSNYAIDPVITPTMYKLANEGIVLNNYYNAFRNTTTNGEFSFLTSLWPDVSRYAKMGTNKGSFAQSAKNLMPLGLGTLFEQQRGGVSRGYHNYLGSYYCRNTTLPNLGFTCKFMNAGMRFTTSWPASDLEMMEQSVDDYINQSEPFCAYYMTFSGHGPYTKENVMYNRNIKTVKELKGERDLNDNALGYFAVNYELEKAMTYLLERLEAAGKLENTVIVMTGDHYPYYLSDQGRNNIAGGKVDTTFDIYKSTCIMWNGGMAEPESVDTYCCNVDILPTILNLFDIHYDSRLMAGNDIFSDSTHVAMLYNKSFLTDGVRYNAANNKAEWDESVTLSDEEKDALVESMSDYVTTRYLMSLKVVDTDFYRVLWEASGISADEKATTATTAAGTTTTVTSAGTATTKP